MTERLRLRRTDIRPLAAGKAMVSLVLADAERLEDARESIVLTVEVEIAGSPLLKEIQRAALERALRALEPEIEATKTWPRPSA